jgi:cephalosporin hydroxylase
LEANDTISARIREFMDQGRFAEAQIECIASLPESSPQRRDLLGEIADRGRERPDMTVPDAYHHWYYDSVVWQNIHWLGVPIFKSPMDLWNYQEIVVALRPSLVIEYGTHHGGSALFFRSILDSAGIHGEVISVDVVDTVDPRARACGGIRFVLDSSTSAAVRDVLIAAIARHPGPIFAILDSDHRADHVYDELCGLRDLLKPGDYLIVEDSNINGHPVLPDWGAGPFEAIERYEAAFPDDYLRDTARELKFGFTFAPRGFLIRK